MLTLTNALSIEGHTVYRDDSSSMHFYVLPDKHPPSVALDENGRPLFSLIVYRRDEDRVAEGEEFGGGIMTFTAEIPVEDRDLKRIKSKLRSLVFGDNPDNEDDVELGIVPFKEGSISVAIAGEVADDEGAVEEGEFTRSIVGEGRVSAIGKSQKAVMVKLTQDGAALFSQISDLRTIPIVLQYDLVFEHRLVGVKMTVWCKSISSVELEKEIEATERYVREDYWGDENRRRPAVSSITETLSRTQSMGVKVVPATSEIDEETLLTLEKFGFDLINKELERIVVANPPTDAQRTDRYLQSYIAKASNSLNFTMTRQMVLERDFIPSGALSGVFANGVDDLITWVDLRQAFFEALTVPLRVNADFDRVGIDSVTVTLSYRSRSPGGDWHTETESFNFTDSSAIQTFRAYANSLDEVDYDWTAEIFYKGSQQTHSISRRDAVDRFLVVGVGDLGILDLSFGMGLVKFEEYPKAKVSIRYDSSELGQTFEHELILSEAQQSDTWIKAIPEQRVGPYQYKVDWFGADSRILEGEWVESTAQVIQVDSPTPDTMSVNVAATGDFKGKLVQVLVTLVYSDPEHDYTRESTLSFNSDSQVQPWEVPLLNPELRDYQYRYELIYQGGAVKSVPDDGSMLPGDPGFIVVGERYDLEVAMYSALLRYDDRCALVMVSISIPDSATDTDRHQSFVFDATNSSNQTLRVDLREGGDPRYHVEIAYHSPSGSVTIVNLHDQTGDKLLIPALPAEPDPPAPVEPPPTPAPVG